MVYTDESRAVCRVLDQHPNTTQKRLSFLVSPTLTAKEFIEQVSTQYSYEKFDLVLEINNVSFSFCYFYLLTKITHNCRYFVFR